jgi:glycosyltransferase involved in cell wall biosynthesis
VVGLARVSPIPEIGCGGLMRILMICAHEPAQDPRIDWEAQFAGATLEVTVLGFAGPGEAPQPAQPPKAYAIRRLPYAEVASWRYLRMLGSTLSPPALVLGAMAGLFALPPLLLLDLALRAARAPAGRSGWIWERALRPLWRVIFRQRIVSRAAYVAALLRTQFGPAATLFSDYVAGLADKPDVIHCNDLDTLLVGVLAKRRFGCRVVYDAHEFYPYSDPGGHWLDVTFFRLLEKHLIRDADAVVTVNSMLAEVLRKTYGLRRVHSVPNAEPWVNHGERPASGPLTLAANGRLKFLFQGRFSPDRGIEELIEAWGRIDGSSCALFLRGPDNACRRQLIARAAELGLLDRSVYFPDAVPEDALVAAAMEADVGIIPYQPNVPNYEFACPNKLSQYLHAGLVVLANDLPYVQAVLNKARAGLFYSSRDRATLVKAIERAAGDPEVVRNGRRNALAYARDHFNWQHFFPTLHRLYTDPAAADALPPEPEV